jgi:hypothetical protein
MTGYTHIELWIGEAYHTGCFADVFDTDVLTVTDARSGYSRVYMPGEWRTATTFGVSGYPDSHFRATTPTRRPVPFTAKELRS